jgi:anti-anti-sigma regulatory factor
VEQAENHMTVNITGSTAFFTVIGRGHAGHAPAFSRVVQQILKAGGKDLVLDLTDCLMLDSTFLGTLVAMADPLPPVKPIVCTLVNPSKMLVRQMEMLEVLPFVRIIHGDRSLAGNPSENQVIEASDPATRNEMARCSLEAHRVLQSLSPANKVRFQPVIDLLEGES